MRKFIAFFFLLAFLVFPLLGYFYFKGELFSKKRINAKFEVRKGESLKEVLSRLKEEGVIDNPFLVYYFARYKGISVKRGCYSFNGRLSPVEVLRELEKGSPCLKEFTVLPGSTIFDLDELFAKKGFCEKGELLSLSKDRKFLKELRVPSLEGFIYPDTYKVNKSATCKEVVEVAVNRFHRVVGELLKNYTPPEKVKLALRGKPSLLSLITVASIVEKETALEKERPLVSAVIYNRLIKGMKVECDPTVIYAFRLRGEKKKRLLYSDLKINSPYNTYLYSGLPPSPICNPSLSSIKAALYPAEVDYLYFVANGRGGHYFAETYSQHLKNVRKYRKWQRGS